MVLSLLDLTDFGVGLSCESLVCVLARSLLQVNGNGANGHEERNDSQDDQEGHHASAHAFLRRFLFRLGLNISCAGKEHGGLWSVDTDID